MGGHHKAKNWGCPDTVDTNGSSPMVLFVLNGNAKGLRGHDKNIYKPKFNTDIRIYSSQIESLTDGTVWTRTLLMHPDRTVSKID